MGSDGRHATGLSHVRHEIAMVVPERLVLGTNVEPFIYKFELFGSGQRGKGATFDRATYQSLKRLLGLHHLPRVP